MHARNPATTIQSGLEALQRWDRDLLQAARRIERRGLTALLKALTRAGDTPGWLVHGLVLYAMLEAGREIVVAMGTAALLSTSSSQLAKRRFRRARPDAAIAGFTARATNPDAWSFPSGHSTVAFSMATVTMAIDPVLGAVETLLAIGIASSRVLLGAHYPVDVIAGAALGLACGLAATGLVG